MKTRRFSFIRHGKVNGPTALYGKTDVELSAHGQQELLGCLERLHQEYPIDYIISSPLKRCAAAAEYFATHHLLPIELNADIQECNFGDWDGIDFDLLKNEWPLLEEFWKSPLNKALPNSETLPTFFNRVQQAWKTIQAQQICEHSIILCHGGTIRMVIADILDIPLETNLFQRLKIDFCSHTYIEISDHVDAKPAIRWIGAPL